MSWFYTYLGPLRSEAMAARFNENYTSFRPDRESIESLVTTRTVERLELEIEFKEDHERRQFPGALLNLICPCCSSKVIFMDRDYWLICPYCEYSVESSSEIAKWVKTLELVVLESLEELQAPPKPARSIVLCDSYFGKLRDQLVEYLAGGRLASPRYFVV